MKKIVFNVDPYTFTGSAIIIGLLLTQELSNDEQDSVGNWLQLIGLIMQTYASQVSTLESSKEQKKDIDMDTLKKAISKIEEKLKNM